MRYLYTIILLLVASTVAAFDPPEGVYSFTLSDGDNFYWHVYNTSYIYANSIDFEERVLRKDTSGVWKYYDPYPVVRFEIPYVEGSSLIRSDVWEAEGLSIVSVFNEDGSEWIDPITGQAWNASTTSEDYSIVDHQQLIDLFYDKLIYLIPLVVALALGFYGVYAVKSWLFDINNSSNTIPKKISQTIPSGHSSEYIPGVRKKRFYKPMRRYYGNDRSRKS